LPKTFFDKSKARSRRFQNSPASRDQTVESTHLSLHQDLLAKNVLMAAQRHLDNNVFLITSLLLVISVWVRREFFEKAVIPWTWQDDSIKLGEYYRGF